MNQPLLAGSPQQEGPPPPAEPNMPTDGIVAKDAPSVPPVPTPLSDEEVTELANELRAAQDFDARWVTLRKTMFARTIAPKQLSKVCQTFDRTRRFQSARELFERGLIDDSAKDLVSTLSMGASWLSPDEAQQLLQQVQAVNTGSQFRGRFGAGFRPVPAPSAPSAPPAPVPSAPPAPSAPPTDVEVEGDAVLVIRHDGKVACVVGDFSRMTANDVMVQAAAQINSDGDEGFVLNKHCLICAHTRHTNFHDNAEVLSETFKPLADLGVKPNDRILWESRSEGRRPSPIQQGALAEIKSMFFVCDASKDGSISKGELRNFLWNMNLDDESLDIVWKKINIRKNDELDIDDLLFFLGRSHLLHKEVPIDALLYDGISVMLRGRQGRSEPSKAAFARWDYDPAVDKQGMGINGSAGAGAVDESCSAFLTIFSPIVILGVAAFLLFRSSGSSSSQSDDDENTGLRCTIAGFCFIYLVAALACSKLGSALNSRTEGFENVIRLLDQPRHENPRFDWHIQCYHMEKTHQRDNGTTEYKRVNTHSASCVGHIPSTDHTAAFVPDTRAASGEVNCEEQHDFSNSNYMHEFVLWKNFHWQDQLAEHSHTERCPSRKDSVLAKWLPGTKPWWMTPRWYFAAVMFGCHYCYAVKMRSDITVQDYVYYKTCYNIQRPGFS